jgi:GPH family glycoside/pentoside/hexuronide:cation symporter
MTHEEKQEDPSLREQVTWGLGGAADNILYNGLNSLIFPIFNLGLGINASLLGLLSSIPRFIDAITDPLMGNISDNTRTRFGRRRPYILGGSILSGILFFLLFLPGRSWNPAAITTWYLPVLILFYLAYTIFIIPFTALGFELAHNPRKRIKVLAWRMYLGLIAGFAIPFIYKACFWFGGDEIVGVKWVAAIIAVYVACSGLAVFFGVKERTPTDNVSIPIKDALKMTFSNRRFLFLSGCFLTVLFGIFIAMPLVIYLNNFHIFSGDKSEAALWYGWYQLATTIGGFIGTVLIPRLPFCRFKTSKVLIATGACSILATWWTFNPAIPWLQLPQAFVFGFSVNSLFLLNQGFLGDICDVEAATQGTSRQGFYAASLEFAKKCAISLSTLCSGLVITLAGVDGVETVDNTLRLRLSFLIVMAAAFAAAFIMFRLFEKNARHDIETLLNPTNDAHE